MESTKSKETIVFPRIEELPKPDLSKDLEKKIEVFKEEVFKAIIKHASHSRSCKEKRDSCPACDYVNLVMSDLGISWTDLTKAGIEGVY